MKNIIGFVLIFLAVIGYTVEGSSSAVWGVLILGHFYFVRADIDELTARQDKTRNDK